MPDILTEDVWERYFSDKVDVSDAGLEIRVIRAERRVVDRYRDQRPYNDRVVPDIGSLSQEGTVQLEGWSETDDGTPDPSSMDDGLLDALRETIARVVEHWETSPSGHVQSGSQGSRSVSYRKGAEHLPRTVWAPLRRFDERTPLSPGLL